MVDGDAGVSGDGRGVAITRLTARRMRIDQGNVVARTLEMQRATAADHAGSNDQ